MVIFHNHYYYYRYYWPLSGQNSALVVVVNEDYDDDDGRTDKFLGSSCKCAQPVFSSSERSPRKRLLVNHREILLLFLMQTKSMNMQDQAGNKQLLYCRVGSIEFIDQGVATLIAAGDCPILNC